MEKDDYILLLKIIEKNGNLESLHRQGLQYSQIARELSEVMEKGYVIHTEKKGFSITKNGRDILLSYSQELKRNGSEFLIAPQKEYILKDTYSKYDIYLPKNTKILD